MAPRVPTVLDGARSPNLNLLTPDPNLVGSPAPGAATVPTGVVDRIEKANKKVMDRNKFRFRSPNANRIVLLYAEPDSILPGGKIVRGKIYQAKFRDGFWETKDNWMTSLGEVISHEQQRDWIKASQFYSDETGVGEMWDADLEEQTAAFALYRGFVNAIQQDPKLLQVLKQDLGSSDFDLIAALAAAKKPSTDPVVEEVP